MDRRDFIKTTSAAATFTLATEIITLPENSSGQKKTTNDEMPWYRRVARWGQTNITEKDPLHYDIDWWRKHWKDTDIQGIIVNAGGIVAYYPSKVPLHRQAEYLGGRDLFGELCSAAHQDGLAVLARMDSNRASEEFYRTHPDWFATDHDGNPYKAGELFITCVNSPYYNEHIPSILTEISVLYKPEGFTDNSWSGLGRDSICYCGNCRKSFHDKTGLEIPVSVNWDDQAYREWIRWNYARRLEIWDSNNRTTRKAGGKFCIWSGMNSGSVIWQSESFRDYREICRRAEIIMLDSQARSDEGGFQQNADTGKLIHGVLGWDKLVPESMAMYQAGKPTFRLSAKPVAEARMWMIEGISGGIQPWWHYVGASHEDRRLYQTPGPLFQWHKANEEYLTNRKPVASVGVVWSQLNTDFYGRDEGELMVQLPWRGITEALIRARIPYIPVHADDIDREAEGLKLLILPGLGVMTDNQIEAVRRFVKGGRGLIATGESSLYNEWGDLRHDYGLNDLFGAHRLVKTEKTTDFSLRNSASEAYHTYLRLTPELRKNWDGPAGVDDPEVHGSRHPAFKGFDRTDILSFGGLLEQLKTDDSAETLMTFIPQFPIYPPETAWMREPRTNIPGLIINKIEGCGNIAFMPADLDRQFARYNLPDHGNLLANLVRWTAKDNIPLSVDCAGLLDCNIYTKGNNLIVHIVNLTSAGTWRQPVDEYIPVGPVTIRARLPEGVNSLTLRLLVSGQTIPYSSTNGWAEFILNSITDHEVIVI
jgi:Hypothetical glycosyl hydrolase 6